MTPWIITAVLAGFIAWIIFVEVKYGRRSKAFFAKTNEEINALGRQATMAYRAKFGHDPTTPFICVDEQDTGEVSSKES